VLRGRGDETQQVLVAVGAHRGIGILLDHYIIPDPLDWQSEWSLLRTAAEKTYSLKNGEFIYKQGDEIESLYLVNSGVLRYAQNFFLCCIHVIDGDVCLWQE